MNKLTVAAMILVSTSLPAMAAPFCLTITGAAPQCVYVDGNQCQADAFRQNGACEPNSAEVKAPPAESVNTAWFCLSDSPIAVMPMVSPARETLCCSTGCVPRVQEHCRRKFPIHSTRTPGASLPIVGPPHQADLGPCLLTRSRQWSGGHRPHQHQPLLQLEIRFWL